MNVIQGDLVELALTNRFDVIVHGCNCQCTMGAGIAVPIRASFPEAYEVDRKTQKGDDEKLGTISVARIDRLRALLWVVNAYTQFDYRGGGVLVNYDAVRSAMREIRSRFADQRIAYPKIGAGLAGGDWPTIAAIIDEELGGLDHTLVQLPG